MKVNNEFLKELKCIAENLSPEQKERLQEALMTNKIVNNYDVFGVIFGSSTNTNALNFKNKCGLRESSLDKTTSLLELKWEDKDFRLKSVLGISGFDKIENLFTCKDDKSDMPEWFIDAVRSVVDRHLFNYSTDTIEKVFPDIWALNKALRKIDNL